MKNIDGKITMSLDQLKELIKEDVETPPFYKDMITACVKKLGWQSFFISPALKAVMYPGLIFKMLNRGLRSNMTNNEFIKCFHDSIRLCSLTDKEERNFVKAMELILDEK